MVLLFFLLETELNQLNNGMIASIFRRKALNCVVTAGVLMDHHHLWPQIGEAALFFASLLQAVTPSSYQAKSKLSVEIGKVWVAHREDMGAQPIAHVLSVCTDAYSHRNSLKKFKTVHAIEELKQDKGPHVCHIVTAVYKQITMKRRALRDTNGVRMYLYVFKSKLPNRFLSL